MPIATLQPAALDVSNQLPARQSPHHVGKVLALGLLILGGCISQSVPMADHSGSNLAERAEAFRARVAAGEIEEARAMMTQNPRRWWDERQGEGKPWTIGPNSGPWAGWDDYFRSPEGDCRVAAARRLRLTHHPRDQRLFSTARSWLDDQ